MCQWGPWGAMGGFGAGAGHDPDSALEMFLRWQWMWRMDWRVKWGGSCGNERCQVLPYDAARGAVGAVALGSSLERNP